jgi:glutamate racemase
VKVGVFDSGIGGLTVVKSLLADHLFAEIIYYGDTARVPYGSKDKNTIIRYAIEAVEFFKNFEIDMIIVACNSVSAFALEEMREVSDVPVIGVIEAGVLATVNALENATDKSILILGTKATIASKAYEKGLEKLGFLTTIPKATPLFVPLVEEGIFEGAVLESVLEYYFHDIQSDVDAVILGCTHFPLIQSSISNYFANKALMIHSGDAIVEYLHKHFALHKRFKQTELKFFASESPSTLKEVAHRWLEL